MAEAGAGEIYKRITVNGIVQGIGFRPFVYRAAVSLGLRGSVRNSGGLVEMDVIGGEDAIAAFIKKLKTEAPPYADVSNIKLEDIPLFFAPDFSITESEKTTSEGQPRRLPPDLPLCAECRAELRDASGRRHGHAFITCASCGPRFSVVGAFPYDRADTSMAVFNMCPQCAKEYSDPSDRRFRAETISCKACGPRLAWTGERGPLSAEDAPAEAARVLSIGGVAAVKGIGGYHLACDPYNEEAVARLRTLKNRDAKPFAVMFRDIRAVHGMCEATEEEEAALLSPPRPVVLLEMKEQLRAFAPNVRGDSGRCGCFLPYAPLHELLFDALPFDALVMTSANRSSAPIITGDADMAAFYAQSRGLLNGVLSHDREILRSADDSVAQAARGGIQIMRRGRGFAPGEIKLPYDVREPILSMGGDLKAAFGLACGSGLTMSQFFGDLENPETNNAYAEGIRDFSRLFGIAPKVVAFDPHPGYFSNELSRRFAREFGAEKLVPVYHHHAHAASVMAEHGLTGKVLGVAFDGTGYGPDGQVWGGEFLLCEGAEFTRVGHLENVKVFAGDEAAVDARRSAGYYVPELLPNVARLALEKNVNTVLSSSMGRLFDALAAILGVCAENAYEGQCGAALQRSAEEARAKGVKPVEMAFSALPDGQGITRYSPKEIISMARKLAEAANRKDEGEGVGAFCLGFHIAVANMVSDAACRARETFGAEQIALSGGVFQNSLLTELCGLELEANGFRVYVNRAVPPNDGGLALGQAYVAGIIVKGGI